MSGPAERQRVHLYARGRAELIFERSAAPDRSTNGAPRAKIGIASIDEQRSSREDPGRRFARKRAALYPGVKCAWSYSSRGRALRDGQADLVDQRLGGEGLDQVVV